MFVTLNQILNQGETMSEDTTTTEPTETEPAVDEKTRTVRPGIFVNIKTSMDGNVTYQRFDIVTGEKLADGSEKSEWNTKKFVEDPEELERGTKVRGMARSMIEKLCRKTAIGLWCAPEQKGALDAARDAADALVAEFNRSAKITRLWISVIPSRLEADDTRALRDITREVSRLVQQMDAGIKEFDVDKIREATAEARQLSGMLTDVNKAKVNAAVAQASKAANTIVKRITKNGEDKALVLLDIQRSQIESARIMFIDMEEQLSAEVVPAMPAVNAQRFADLDLESNAADCTPVENAKPERDLDLGSNASDLKMVASPSFAAPRMEV